MTPYINIHTHHLTNENGISIYNNRFLFDKEIKTEKLFSIGIHPYDINLVDENSFKELEKKLNHKNCIAIGECGLDKLKNADLISQKIVLQKQLELAVKYNKPLIIHCVKAFDELIELCKPFENKIQLIIHGFNKSEELALQLISNGFYLSLNHTIFNKENFNFTKLPINKLFFETDDYTLISISDVYKKASVKLKIDENELKEKIYSNFNLLFL
jgi:TatD DNase family protein